MTKKRERERERGKQKEEDFDKVDWNWIRLRSKRHSNFPDTMKGLNGLTAEMKFAQDDDKFSNHGGGIVAARCRKYYQSSLR